MAEIIPQSSGVQELIQRLREQGVEEGQQEAERVVEEAHRRAAQIITTAKAEGEDVKAKARSEAESERASAEAALRTAYRDSILRLVEELTSHFEGQIKRLVSRELQDTEFLKKLIMEVARQATPSGIGSERVEVLLPAEHLDFDELRARPEEVKEGTLTHFVMGLSGEMLRGGVELKSLGGSGQGVRIRLVGSDLEIDLTERAVADLLLKHLLPRYRAVLEGVIR